jgi:uncharacterized protein
MKGKLVHMELPAEDTKRAMKFWGDLAGWNFQSYEGPVEYNMFEGQPGGAIFPAQESDRGPIVYFEAEDIDAEIERIRELGGTADDKAPVPSMGWFARAKDTEGNTFAVWQSDDSAPGPES